MGRWLEHSVTTEVQASAERVWAVWSDLEAMPRWMRWIESVTTLDDPDLTDWTLAAQGFRFHWKARITQRVDQQQLHWESVGGLPTRGAVRFYPEAADRTVVKLSVMLFTIFKMGYVSQFHHFSFYKFAFLGKH